MHDSCGSADYYAYKQHCSSLLHSGCALQQSIALLLRLCCSTPLTVDWFGAVT
jgi:hypothetical protein